MELPALIQSVLSDKLKQQTVVIFGLGTEGFSTYQTIRSALPEQQVWICDDKPVPELLAEWQAALKADAQVHFFQSNQQTAAHLKQIWPQQPVVVIKTPGIPFTNPFFRLLTQLQTKITYTSNLQLFFDILYALPVEQRPQTIGVTGTKGKSTTTALIFHVLQQAGKTALLAGNIGVPALELLIDLQELPATQLNEAVVVLELSSHQLQALPYSPHIAVVQNVTPEHLDYYQDFEEYVAAKAPIASHQTDQDYIIFNPDYEIPRRFAQHSPARQLPYALRDSKTRPIAATSAAPVTELVATLEAGCLSYQGEPICAVQDIPLQGEHNVLNTFPSLIVGKLMGIETTQIAAAIHSFKSLPHRLEFVTEHNGVSYYNDSQGTTPEASIAAIRSFAGRPIVLLAGGSDKGVTFNELAEAVLNQHVTDVILFPPTGEKIEQAIKSSAHHQNKSTPHFHPVASMQEAVTLAAQRAQTGGVVLLSPACASFGLFKNYQDRGNQFKAAALAVS